MKGKNIYVWIALFFLCSCDNPSLNPPEEGAPVFNEKSALDKKIKEIYDTYDVQIKYEWDRKAFATGAVADPADTKDVLPYIEILEELYFKALAAVEEPGSDFVKKETPITIYLIGSGINYGGKEVFGEGTVGQAGNIQPNRLTLGGLNEFGEVLRIKGNDRAFLNMVFDEAVSSFPGEGGLVGFVYHEFNHFVDSKNDIPKGFEKITFNDYVRGTSVWRSITDSAARARGFAIPYGMQNEHEDMSTYVQIMVWQPDSIIQKEYSVSEGNRIKLKMLYEYYLNLGLDLHKLRAYLYTEEMKNNLLAIKRKYEPR